MKLKQNDPPSQSNKTIFVSYNGKAVKDRGFTDKDSAVQWIADGIKEGRLTWTNGWSFRVKGTGFDAQLVDRRGNLL